MIRINLLGRDRPRVKRRVPVTGALQLALVLVPIGLAIVLLVVLLFNLRREASEIQAQITQKQAERARLSQLEKEIQAFEKKQALLEGRIRVIEQLKANQQGPVHLLDSVGRTVSLTDTLWLTSMQEKAANEIEFKGMAGSMEAVANFITNLQNSGSFENVEMRETLQQARREGPSFFEFTLSAKFKLPAPPPTEAAAAPSGAAAGGQS